MGGIGLATSLLPEKLGQTRGGESVQEVTSLMLFSFLLTFPEISIDLN